MAPSPTHDLAPRAHELLNPSSRLRRSPTFDRVKAAGAKAYSVYNRTLIGQWFGSLEEDYAHLKSAVQVWDVGGERIVEVAGPDAARLIQTTTLRDVAAIADDQCAYAPMVDARGRLLNDPVLTKVSEDRYWLALADSDMLLYLKGLALGGGYAVDVFEPDVWLLAVQGPRADDLAAAVFGDAVRDIRFFRHARVKVAGRPMILARTGFSLQGGFELHVEGGEHAGPIWDALMEAGRAFDVRAGCPNLIERIEGGLLSYGADITDEHTPFEGGLERFCTMDRDIGCAAFAALSAERSPRRQIRPVEIHGPKGSPLAHRWIIRDHAGATVGAVSSAAWSPDLETTVGIAMIERAHWDPETRLIVDLPDGARELVVKDEFWGRRRKKR